MQQRYRGLGGALKVKRKSETRIKPGQFGLVEGSGVTNVNVKDNAGCEQ